MTALNTQDELADAIARLPGFGWGIGQSDSWSPMTEGYWRAAGEGVLTVQRCDACGVFRWPPNEVCFACHSMEWTWTPVSGQGRVYTYMWADNVPIPGQEVYNMSVIELDGLDGDPVRILSQVVEATRESLQVGKAVSVEFVALGGGLAVPQWRLTDAE
ncbi:Zn-ribbon domain-containing OB-fold protein [Jatrophihabitans sp. DSM 45814]